jgi:hypothetical protein
VFFLQNLVRNCMMRHENVVAKLFCQMMSMSNLHIILSLLSFWHTTQQHLWPNQQMMKNTIRFKTHDNVVPRAALNNSMGANPCHMRSEPWANFEHSGCNANQNNAINAPHPSCNMVNPQTKHNFVLRESCGYHWLPVHVHIIITSVFLGHF